MAFVISVIQPVYAIVDIPIIPPPENANSSAITKLAETAMVPISSPAA